MGAEQGKKHIISDAIEHHAVLHTLKKLEKQGFEVTYLPVHENGLVRLEELRAAIREDTCLVTIMYVNNEIGTIQPVREIGALCREKGVPLIVDASQSAGIHPVSLGRWGAAYVTMPGHKGLYGPQGTGLLLCGEGQRPKPVLEGGTGSLSRLQEMPDFLPDRLEAGTQNVHGAAGLLEGLRFVRRMGLERIARREGEVMGALAAGLKRKGGYQVFDSGADSSVLSVVPQRTDPETMADRLAAKGVAVRAGLHCAPLAHVTAGTAETGTLRFSASLFNTVEEAEKVLEML